MINHTVPGRLSGPHIRMAALLAASALIISACASGPDRRPPPGSGERSGGIDGLAAKPIALLFTSMDTNNDLVIDGSELVAGIDLEWVRLSTGGSTTALNFGDWAERALGSKDAMPSFISFDTNIDGTLSRTEFNDRLRDAFTALDKSGNTALERSELIFRVSRPSQTERGNQGGQRGGGQGQGQRRPQR